MTKSISILIPVYNVDVSALVLDLHSMLFKENIGFEVIIFDDGSQNEFKFTNRKINFDNCSYVELEKNVGRSAIRNKLVSQAQYNTVLILDCDVKPKSNSFITNYIPYLDADFVVSGGTEYENLHSDPKTILHWKAGKYKEQKPFEARNLNPYHSFTLNNLLIPKSIYLTVLLDEKIITYGHEDSKFGFELEKKKIKLLHIDNPVYHIGLNDAENYVYKSISAAENLVHLVKNENIGTNTKLYKTYIFLRKTKTTKIFKLVFKILKPIVYCNLKSKKPKLFFLDLVKLNAFILKYENL